MHIVNKSVIYNHRHWVTNHNALADIHKPSIAVKWEVLTSDKLKSIYCNSGLPEGLIAELAS